MTDNEIIKALECCELYSCHKCPLIEQCIEDDTFLPKYAIDLIKRQQAEIERLQKQHRLNLLEQLDVAENIKAEAIKEFAEKFKQRCIDGGIFPAYINRQLEITLKEFGG